jgi:hypothetical protein
VLRNPLKIYQVPSIRTKTAKAKVGRLILGNI